MTQYIDKDALVTEIERRKQVAYGWMETAPNDAIEAEFGLCDDILSFLDTLEVKEVDLDGISRYYALNNSPWDDCRDEIQDAYKAGFELGLKAQKGE